MLHWVGCNKFPSLDTYKIKKSLCVCQRVKVAGRKNFELPISESFCFVKISEEEERF